MQPPTSHAYVDLHLHSNASDGSDAPATVVRRAAHLGFRAIALTDHDTVAGLAEAEGAARNHGLAFLNGTEISAVFDRRELHVVGLGIRPDDPPLSAALEKLQQDRAARADAIVDRLNRLGVPIDRAQVQARAAGGAIGRIHIAQALHALGVSRTVQQAFDQYIGKGRRAYVAKTALPCADAVDLIHAARGLAFVAHPGIGATTHKLLPRLLALPFDGIEAYHSNHTPGQVTAFTCLAEERGLLISGGSDCHGAAKAGQADTEDPPATADLGKVRVPYAHLERIVDALSAKQGR